MKKVFLVLSLMLGLNSFAYEFNIGEREFSYNPDTLKFYESSVTLSAEEVQELFPDYQVILISKFDKEKKYKIKNSLFGVKKILLLKIFFLLVVKCKKSLRNASLSN